MATGRGGQAGAARARSWRPSGGLSIITLAGRSVQSGERQVESAHGRRGGEERCEALPSHVRWVVRCGAVRCGEVRVKGAASKGDEAAQAV